MREHGIWGCVLPACALVWSPAIKALHPPVPGGRGGEKGAGVKYLVFKRGREVVRRGLKVESAGRKAERATRAIKRAEGKRLFCREQINRKH